MAMTEDELQLALLDVASTYLDSDEAPDLDALVRTVGVVLAQLMATLLGGTDASPEEVQTYLAQAFMALEVLTWKAISEQALDEEKDAEAC